MRKHFSDDDLRAVLGADLGDSDIIDTRIEEAYIMIRNSGNRAGREGRKRKNMWRGLTIGLGSTAAVLALTFTFCVMNPVMAKEIPVLGGIFEKMADIFSFGKLPEE